MTPPASSATAERHRRSPGSGAVRAAAVHGAGSGRSQANGAAPSGSQAGGAGCGAGVPGRSFTIDGAPVPPAASRRQARCRGPAGPRSLRLRCSRNSSAATASSGRRTPPCRVEQRRRGRATAMTSPIRTSSRGLRPAAAGRVADRARRAAATQPAMYSAAPMPVEGRDHEPDPDEHGIDVVAACDAPRRRRRPAGLPGAGRGGSPTSPAACRARPSRSWDQTCSAPPPPHIRGHPENRPRGFPDGPPRRRV